MSRFPQSGFAVRADVVLIFLVNGRVHVVRSACTIYVYDKLFLNCFPGQSSVGVLRGAPSRRHPQIHFVGVSFFPCCLPMVAPFDHSFVL